MDRFPGHRIDDVRHLDLERVTAHDSGQLGVVHDLVADKARAMQLAVRVAEDCPRATDLSPEERLERLALRFVRPLVDERNGHAIPFMYRGRPVRVLADGHAVEGDVTVGALLDRPRPATLALARGGPPIKIAWA